jgi:hypothetical protein
MNPEPLAWLWPILTRKKRDGSYYYSNQDLAAFFPVMLLTFGFRAADLTPALAEVMRRFAEEAGVRPGASREEAQAALQAFLAQNPLHPELVFEFKRGLQEEAAHAGDAGPRLARWIGAQPGGLGGLIDRRAPPEGSVRGGPLARLSAEQALSKKR